MSCGHAIEDLSAFVDRELPDRERSKLLDRLDGCPSCRFELLQLEGIARLVREMGEVDPPEGFLHQVMERIAAEDEMAAALEPSAAHEPAATPRLKGPWLSWTMAAASLLLVIGFWQVMEGGLFPSAPKTDGKDSRVGGEPQTAVSGVDSTAGVDHADAAANPPQDPPADRPVDQGKPAAPPTAVVRENRDPTSLAANEATPEASAGNQQPPKDEGDSRVARVPQAKEGPTEEKMSIMSAVGSEEPFLTEGEWRYKVAGDGAKAVARLVEELGGRVLTDTLEAKARVMVLEVPAAGWGDFLQGMEDLGDFLLKPAEKPQGEAKRVECKLRLAH